MALAHFSTEKSTVTFSRKGQPASFKLRTPSARATVATALWRAVWTCGRVRRSMRPLTLNSGAVRRLHRRTGPLLSLARPNLGNPLGERNLEPLLRFRVVVKIRHADPRETAPDRPLDVAHMCVLLRRDEGERFPGRVGSPGPSDPMNIVLGYQPARRSSRRVRVPPRRSRARRCRSQPAPGTCLS